MSSNIIADYETVFILDSSIGDENIKAAVERFEGLINANGTVVEKNEWGIRKLAYPIQFKEEGYYVLIYFNANPGFLKELDRIYNITDSVLRSLVIKRV